MQTPCSFCHTRAHTVLLCRLCSNSCSSNYYVTVFFKKKKKMQRSRCEQRKWQRWVECQSHLWIKTLSHTPNPLFGVSTAAVSSATQTAGTSQNRTVSTLPLPTHLSLYRGQDSEDHCPCQSRLGTICLFNFVAVLSEPLFQQLSF